MQMRKTLPLERTFCAFMQRVSRQSRHIFVHLIGGLPHHVDVIGWTYSPHFHLEISILLIYITIGLGGFASEC